MDDLWAVERGSGPLLATAIHDGHDLRPAIAARMVLDEPIRLREEDPYTHRWITVAPTNVSVRRSRFEVDLNRPRGSAVYRSPAEAWGLKVWDGALPDDVVEESLAQHDAFYDLMTELCRAKVRDHGGFVLLDVHSYNHRRDGHDAPPGDPNDNPVVNVGTGTLDRVRWGPLVDRFIRELAGHEVAGTALDVRENVRFQGGYLSRWVHEKFPTTGCCLALEFKKVYMDEWTGEPHDAVIADLLTALQATVPGLVASLPDALAAEGTPPPPGGPSAA